MYNSLMPIDYDGKIIRTAEEAGQIFFHANDVCNILGFTNSWKAISDHVDEEDLTKRESLTKGGVQKANYLNESGLYALIFGSRLPKAKEFKRWVTSEVLPAIRKSGSYSIPNTSQDRFESTFDLSLYHELIATQKELIESQREQLRMSKLLLEPKEIRNGKSWTSEEDMLLIDLRAEGLRWKEIAQKMNRGIYGVAKRYKRLGE